MKDHTDIKVPFTTEPVFKDVAKAISNKMRQYSLEELATLMGTSINVGKEAYRFYHTEYSAINCMPAILSFCGRGYDFIDTGEYSNDDFVYAHNHLIISSLMYGLLRPLDLIMPYRISPKAEIDGVALPKYWQPKLTDLIIKRVNEDDGVLLFLGGMETKSMLDWKRIEKEVKVVAPEFYVLYKNRLKCLNFQSHSCRRNMVSHVIKHQSSLDELFSNYNYEGYNYNTKYGNPQHPCFVKL